MGTSTRLWDTFYSITSLMSLLLTHSGHQAREDSIAVTLAHRSHWFSVYHAALLWTISSLLMGPARQLHIPLKV